MRKPSKGLERYGKIFPNYVLFHEPKGEYAIAKGEAAFSSIS